MTAEYTEKDGVLIVMPGSRLDTASAPSVEQQIMARIEAGASKIVFDFERTDYVSSAGLRVLLKAAKTLTKSGGGLVICRTNTHLKEVLELSGFHMVIKVAKTLDKAIAML